MSTAISPGSATTPQREPSPHSTTIVGWLLAALLAVVVIAGLLTGLLRETPTFDSTTPDGVVQSYAQAVLGDHYVAARDHLTDELQTRCAVVDFRNAWVPDPTTVTLEDTTVTGDVAAVTINLRALAGPGPFGVGDGVQTEVLDLVREGDAWRITGDPWPVYDCGR